MKAVSDFRGKVDETQTQLDTFSGNVIKDFTDDIDTKLESIGKDIESEVEKVTAELKEIGLESLQTTDLNDAVDIFTDIVHQVNVESYFRFVHPFSNVHYASFSSFYIANFFPFFNPSLKRYEKYWTVFSTFLR